MNQVKTADDLTAGTDLDVFVKLEGQYATTINIPLNAERSVLRSESDNPNFGPDHVKHVDDALIADTSLFDSGQTDTFKITLPYLGKIEHVSLAVPPALITDEFRVEKCVHACVCVAAQ